MNPCFETATRLARAIRNGRLSSVEVTKAHLDRIARVNGPLNALVLVDEAGAMKAAKAADRARSRKKSLGLLHGVPITIKEAFDVAGLKTTSSHPPLKDQLDAGARQLEIDMVYDPDVGLYANPPGFRMAGAKAASTAERRALLR